MSTIDSVQRSKKNAFEYFVICLDKWRKDVNPSLCHPFTKLQLHKLLFLASSIGAFVDSHPMLDVFNKFYALQYGPVEIDIYHMMVNNGFTNIQFKGNDCVITNSSDIIENVEINYKTTIDAAIESLRNKNENYVIIPPFQLVEITHGWTVWQVANSLASIFDSKMEPMNTFDIINSSIKTF